jgi:hypothetical protein
MARGQRKLATILAADVVSYSRLMGRDEEVLDGTNTVMARPPFAPRCREDLTRITRMND